MKGFLIFIFVLGSFFARSQDQQSKEQKEVTYLSFSEYKKIRAKLAKSDSVSFKIQNGDTVVKMPSGYVHPKREGVPAIYKKRDSLFLKKYTDLVFNDEKSTVKLWKDDLKLFVDPSVPPVPKEDLLNFAEKLSAAVDSLNIVEVNSPEESNFLVYFTGYAANTEYEPELSGITSGFYIYWNHNQHITKGFIKINQESFRNASGQSTAIKINFLKALGFFGSSGLAEDFSYFSNKRSDLKLFSDLDLEILKYHYSAEFCKGVNQTDFEKFHKQMLGVLQKDPKAILQIYCQK